MSCDKIRGIIATETSRNSTEPVDAAIDRTVALYGVAADTVGPCENQSSTMFPPQTCTVVARRTAAM